MNNHTFDPEITTLVRRFSEKVAQEMPNDTIAQALGTWEEEEKARESKDAAWQIFLQFTETRSYPFSKQRKKTELYLPHS